MKWSAISFLLLALLAGVLLWMRGAAPQSSIAPTRGPATESQPAAPDLPAPAPKAGALGPEELPQRTVIRRPVAPAPESSVVRVHGRVLDAHGEPVPGAEVQLRPAYGPGPEGETYGDSLRRRRKHKGQYLSVVTDAGGAYSIDDTVPGLYELWVDEVTRSGARAPREVLLESDLERDFHLGGFLELGGRVLRALPGPVRLELTRGGHGEGGVTKYCGGGVRELEAGGDGAFLFRGLEPGFFLVRTTSPVHASQSFEFELTTSITGANLSLERGLTFAGELELALAGRHPRVYFRLTHADAVEHRWTQGNWFGEGPFRFEDLRRGTYELEVLQVSRERSTGRRMGGDDRQQLIRRRVVHLAGDIEDYLLRIEDDIPLWIDARLPPGGTSAPLVEGRLVARNGDAIHESLVRLRTWRGKLSREQVGGTSRGDGSFRGWDDWQRTERFMVPVPPGTWDVSLELEGYEPWTERVEVKEERSLEVALEARSGRFVTSGYESVFHHIESRRAGAASAWKPLLWRDARIVSSHGRPDWKTSAWLAVGRYDLRVTSDDHAELIEIGVLIEDSTEPLVVEFPRETGLAIEGRLESFAGARLGGSLYLDRREPSSWVRLARKTQLYGGTFTFRGLNPGTYRATLDTAGRVVVATWEFGDEDLLDQVIVVGE